jgi:outer membrane protein TolC
MAELLAAGNVTATSAAHEDLARARAHAEVARALDRAREARESLAALMGLAGDEPGWQVAGRLELPEVGGWPEDVEAAALEASLELRAGRAQVRALALHAEHADVEAALATASLGLSYEREFESGESGLGPALAISVPLFDTGAARESAGELELAAELERQRQLAVEVRVAARRLLERERSLTAQLAHVEEIERPAAEAYLQAVLQDYNSMQVAAFDVLGARSEELESERAWIAALERAWIARLELRELLDGVLREAPGREAGVGDGLGRGGHRMPGGR